MSDLKPDCMQDSCDNAGSYICLSHKKDAETPYGVLICNECRVRSHLGCGDEYPHPIMKDHNKYFHGVNYAGQALSELLKVATKEIPEAYGKQGEVPIEEDKVEGGEVVEVDANSSEMSIPSLYSSESLTMVKEIENKFRDLQIQLRQVDKE